MARLQTWILLFWLGTALCAPLIYTGQPLVLPESYPNVHLHLDEDPTDVIVSDFSPLRAPKIYPLTPQEMGELYLKMSKHPSKFLKYLQHLSGGKLKSPWKVGDGKKCCGNELVYNGAFGRHRFNEVTKPVFQLGYGYPSNQIQEYRNNDVKPVMEHIEGDLKYDFRTNTHSY